MKNVLKYKVGKGSGAYATKMTWGYAECSVVDAKGIRQYVELLDRESLRAKFGGECICPEIKERLNVIVNKYMEKTKIDPSEFKDTKGYNFWAYTNSDCIVPTHYQKWCNQFLCDLQVSISFYNKKKDCNLDLLTFITKEEVCETTLPAIKVALEKVCKLDVDATIKSEGCDVGAQVFLVKNYCNIENDFKISEKDCNLAYNGYITQHACDIDINAFKEATKEYINC